MFFNGWPNLLRVVAVGVPAYIALVLLLRISGKRTLSKLNAFDLIVTVAFGSTLSAGLLNTDLALAEIVGAFALLVLLQFLITWSSVRWPVVHRLIKAEPRLLYHGGEFLRESMHRERITEIEVMAAIRASGHGAVEAVESVVMETDGTISIVSKVAQGTAALKTVRGHPRAAEGE